MTELTLTHARIVLPDAVVEGTVHARDGRIADVSEGAFAGSRAGGAIDLEGDYLVPGLVELHTDHVEPHFTPRPGVRWDPTLAVVAHDAQIAGSGITTVFDALCIGMDQDRVERSGAEELRGLVRATRAAQDAGLLRAEHFTHLRCEVAAPGVMEDWAAFEDEPSVRLVSLMDHTPGQRQFTSLDAHMLFYKGRNGMSDAQYDAFVAERRERALRFSDRHRRAIARAARERGLPIASHDDATSAHVDEAVRDGIALAEFPTTLEAADASRANGIAVLMGAPNVVRGKSHSGNVAALDLARAGALDILSSDYVPYALMQAAFALPERTRGEAEPWDLPRAIRTVTKTPAETIGLRDRGAIEPGRRADLVRVRLHEGRPIVREVWREGRRVS